MTERVNVAGLDLVTTSAFTGLFTLNRTGRSGCLRPLAEVVTKRRYFSIRVAVLAARAGVRRVTARSAGRCSYNCNVVVSECVDVVCNVAVVAARAGISRITLLRAGRCGHDRTVSVYAAY